MNLLLIMGAGIVFPMIYLFTMLLIKNPEKMIYSALVWLVNVILLMVVWTYMLYGCIHLPTFPKSMTILGKIPVIIIAPMMICLIIVTWKMKNKIEEISARYLLDELPKIQMEIDAEVNKGSLTWEESKKKRALPLNISTLLVVHAELARLMMIEAIIIAIAILISYIIGTIINGTECETIIILGGTVIMGSAICMIIALYVVSRKTYHSVR